MPPLMHSEGSFMPTGYRLTSKESVERDSVPIGRSNLWAWALLLVILLVITAIRIRLLAMPLERDEGEFAYMGQLMLDGIPPYKIAYSMKLPGIYAAYALVMAVFGQTTVGIHLGLLLVNLTSIALVFLLGKRLVDPTVGVVAAASYAFSSLSRHMLGTSAHAMHFVLPFILGGMLLMLKGIESGKARTFFWSGLLLGIGFVVKQHGALFIPFAAIYVFWALFRVKPVCWKDLLRKEGLLLAGSAIPFGLTCSILYKLGVFKNFWFWTFTYAREYTSEVQSDAILPTLLLQIMRITGPHKLLWLLGVGGLIILFADSRLREKRFFLAGFALFAFLITCPGFYFRQHYFIPFLAAIGLLAGVAVTSAQRWLSGRKYTVRVRSLPLVLVAALLLYGVLSDGAFLFVLSPSEASRYVYGANPFPEIIQVADYIKAHSDENDKIAVLGSEPELFFYAHRRSATGYIYTYGLMEPQKYARQMQREMIREIESARPKYIVYVSIPTSWLRKAASDRTIFMWQNQFLENGYELVGAVDFIDPNYVPFYWDEDAGNFIPEAPDYILVFKRIN